jgi:hypothetical protein
MIRENLKQSNKYKSKVKYQKTTKNKKQIKMCSALVGTETSK